MPRVRRVGLLLGVLLVGGIWLFSYLDTPRTTPLYTYRVVNTYPHDRHAFTQGLVFDAGYVYEGTGLHGRSSVRQVELTTGRVVQMHHLDSQWFGEGITIMGDRLFQLTWKARRGFVYDKRTLQRLREFTYSTEGWGITHDGSRLILSDGTATLYFLDPDTFADVGRIRVYDHRGPVDRLNELEYIRGEVYANIWQSDRIARIDPRSGRVTGWINLTGLLPRHDRSQHVDVLNGIAYDATQERIFVTGKLWPKLFEIEVLASR